MIFEQSYLGNETWRFLILLGSIMAGLIAGRVIAFGMNFLVSRWERREQRQLPQLILKCLSKPIIFFFFVIGLEFGLAVLNLATAIRGAADKVISTFYALALGYAIYRLVDIVDHYLGEWARKTESRLDDMLVPMVRKSLRITIGVIVAIFVVQNFYGTERMATLLAGLGVGGLAVALAAQDTIKNFFGSFMILVDKPFHVGDRIKFAGHDGPVEQVGFRTTRIRTMEGHLVTVPNSKIMDEAVENIGQRPYIRRFANITITYDTPPDKVVRAVEILRELLNHHEGMSADLPPRVYFSEFNDASLNIVMLYWYHPADWWQYMEFTHKLNMQILERFNAEGIEFAFPTQTIYLANDARRQLALRMLGDTEQPG